MWATDKEIQAGIQAHMNGPHCEQFNTWHLHIVTQDDDQYYLYLSLNGTPQHSQGVLHTFCVFSSPRLTMP